VDLRKILVDFGEKKKNDKIIKPYLKKWEKFFNALAGKNRVVLQTRSLKVISSYLQAEFVFEIGTYIHSINELDNGLKIVDNISREIVRFYSELSGHSKMKGVFKI